MKFLCRNCKAKYQIADEKVAGRTLRMTCQQCGEPIVVRGPARQSGPAGVSRPVAPAAMSAAPGALHGADLAHHLAAPAREPAIAHEEWHVAIHDSPVGPLRRDEVARRIGQGHIDRESLAWREGMDDWLPIKHIAELSALFGGGTGPSHGGSGALKLQQLSAAPSARVDMAPIGGRQVVPAEEYAAPAELEAAPVAVATVAAAADSAPAESRQPGWAQMFALVSGGAFILAAGALLGVRVLAPSNQSSPTPPAAAAAAVAPPTAPAPSANRPVEGATGSVIELDTQSIDGASAPGQRKPGTTGAAPTPTPNPNDKNKRPLTAEQKEMLERMGGGLNQGGPSNLRAPTETARSPSGQTGQLTSEQLSAVVLNGRKNLQRCYETALRGSNSNETVRLDVDIEVSPSGNVTSAHTSGKGLAGMEECIVRTVRMWRFPMSGEATQTHFPVVFQPGA